MAGPGVSGRKPRIPRETLAKVISGTATTKELSASLGFTSTKEVDKTIAQFGLDKSKGEAFRKLRADIFSHTSEGILVTLQKAVGSLREDLEKGRLNEHQKIGMISVLSSSHGILYDKERLERGQSTQNHSNLISIAIRGGLSNNGMMPVEGGPSDSRNSCPGDKGENDPKTAID